MPSRFGVSELGRAIAQDGGETFITRGFRTLITRGGIIPTGRDGAGETAPVYFDKADACRALVLYDLYRMGLTPEALAVIRRDFLDNFPGHRDDGIGLPKPGRDSADRMLEAAWRVDQGKAVYFHLFIAPAYLNAPADILGGAFSELSDFLPHPYARRITIPLGPVLGPFLRTANAG